MVMFKDTGAIAAFKIHSKQDQFECFTCRRSESLVSESGQERSSKLGTLHFSLFSEETKEKKIIKKAKAKCPESLDGLMNYEIRTIRKEAGVFTSRISFVEAPKSKSFDSNFFRFTGTQSDEA